MWYYFYSKTAPSRARKGITQTQGTLLVERDGSLKLNKTNEQIFSHFIFYIHDNCLRTENYQYCGGSIHSDNGIDPGGRKINHRPGVYW
ncbi:MAG: hypothetical protein RIQ72_401 [Candidatus Parcubacteria bacterium]